MHESIYKQYMWVVASLGRELVDNGVSVVRWVKEHPEFTLNFQALGNHLRTHDVVPVAGNEGGPAWGLYMGAISGLAADHEDEAQRRELGVDVVSLDCACQVPAFVEELSTLGAMIAAAEDRQ